jgi:O-antigen ligase/tetratricopeptide (TPR) repeat protein
MALAESARPALQRWTIVLTALLAPTLGGSTEPWSQAVILALIASAIFLRAPGLFVGKAFAGIALAALVLGALAWAPASFWGETWWRRILIQELGMKLPGTFSVQPWLSADAFVLLTSGILWLVLLAAQEWTNVERRWLARRVCGGFILLATAWLVVHYAGWKVPIWICDRNFGPFPNRNQTGDLLATWSVIAAACAAEDYRRGRWSGTFWLAGIAVFLWGLVVNYSRAGVMLFFLGLVGWGTLQFVRDRSIRYLAVGFATILVAVSLFFIFGGSTLERFTTSDGLVHQPLKDFRALVFRDAWNMACRSPWTGAGLGNFEGMFTMAREASANHVRLIHPENDWLWMLVEMGWLGPVLALAMVGLLVRRTFPLEKKSASTIRSAALVGALLFGFHGFFDVSGHRLGSAIPGLMLFGLAARLPWTAAPSILQPWLTRAGALMIGTFAFGWITATVQGWPWPGAISARLFNTRAQIANQEERFQHAIDAADRALAIAALDWENHYIRGVAHAFLEQFDEAERDFRRARRLEPSIASAPYEEGRIWMYFDPPRAKSAWSEALRREPERNVEYFRKMLADVRNSGARRLLRELAGKRTDLLLEWLGIASSEEFQFELERLKREGHLADWSALQLAQLFEAWLRAGDRTQMIQEIESDASWYAAGWRQLAAAYASAKDFERACDITHQWHPAPVLPDLPERELRAVMIEASQFPRDFITGYQLYRAEARAGDWTNALTTLDRLAALPDPPAYLTWLRAEALEHLGRFPEAWDALSRAIR